LLVVSGHDPGVFDATIAGVRPGDLTLVVMMGVGRAAAIASALLSRGWRAHTPAAIVVNASAPDQRVWRGTLETLGEGADMIEASAPGTIVVGDVVNLADSGVRQDRAYVSNR
jgi:siroheme synthase